MLNGWVSKQHVMNTWKCNNDLEKYLLTHWDRVTHICVGKLNIFWFRLWLVACSAPSHYLNQCWNIANCTHGNKRQWNFNRNSNIFIQEYASEKDVRDITAILSRPQCVNGLLWWAATSISKWWHYVLFALAYRYIIPRHLLGKKRYGNAWNIIAYARHLNDACLCLGALIFRCREGQTICQQHKYISYPWLTMIFVNWTGLT